MAMASEQKKSMPLLQKLAKHKAVSSGSATTPKTGEL